MKTPPAITDTEWKIMQVLWTKAPLTAGEICQALQREDPSWHPKTAHTLITRLVKKGALSFVSRGRAYFYEPLFTAEECADQASASFLDRVFGGSLQPMLAHFVEQQKLSAKDIRELKRILEGGK
ncbi:MAG: BlaI/MecI/CopY family transcriptional regulator [Chthoniobacter sp.]|uniref:BlaI/MecI/CopY family transcriptional regulator n=1 Tax=Chthoniobacter sp. TaxID=2510640 RepID=UPI0032AC92E5